MVGRYPRFRLRFFASVSNPHLVQSPDDLRPADPFGLAPSLTSHSPIIDREIIFLFLRKTNWSSRPSSGSRAVRRVIADWSLVRPFAFRWLIYDSPSRVAPSGKPQVIHSTCIKWWKTGAKSVDKSWKGNIRRIGGNMSAGPAFHSGGRGRKDRTFGPTPVSRSGGGGDSRDCNFLS